MLGALIAPGSDVEDDYAREADGCPPWGPLPLDLLV
jgi:hypothetical protein